MPNIVYMLLREVAYIEGGQLCCRLRLAAVLAIECRRAVGAAQLQDVIGAARMLCYPRRHIVYFAVYRSPAACRTIVRCDIGQCIGF